MGNLGIRVIQEEDNLFSWPYVQMANVDFFITIIFSSACYVSMIFLKVAYANVHPLKIPHLTNISLGFPCDTFRCIKWYCKQNWQVPSCTSLPPNCGLGVWGSISNSLLGKKEVDISAYMQTWCGNGNQAEKHTDNVKANPPYLKYRDSTKILTLPHSWKKQYAEDRHELYIKLSFNMAFSGEVV